MASLFSGNIIHRNKLFIYFTSLCFNFCFVFLFFFFLPSFFFIFHYLFQWLIMSMELDTSNNKFYSLQTFHCRIHESNDTDEGFACPNGFPLSIIFQTSLTTETLPYFTKMSSSVFFFFCSNFASLKSFNKITFSN